MIRLTKTGTLFLGVLVLFYLASLTSQSGLLLLLIGILAGCYGVNLVAAWRTVKGLEIYPPASVHLSEGQKTTQPWRITNAGTRAAGFVQVESAEGLLFRLARLAAKGEAHIAPDLIYWKRGVYAYAEVRLASVYPFGLIKATRRLRLPGEVVVYPALYPAAPARAAGYDAMFGGKFKGRRRSNTGANFAGVRPFQAGDSFKQIHWKSSAKGLGLMVGTFDEELSGRVAIIIHCSLSGGPTTLDDCIRAAGSLVFAALDAGHHVEWNELNRPERLILSPFDDGQGMLDRLARIQPDRGLLTADALYSAVERVSRKSALSFVLTEANAAVWEAAAFLKSHGRKVDVYLPDHSNLADDGNDLPVFTYTAHELKARA
ncbi:MAG: DUF58 domain-containing protein [Limisphaerales bacterium]